MRLHHAAAACLVLILAFAHGNAAEAPSPLAGDWFFDLVGTKGKNGIEDAKRCTAKRWVHFDGKQFVPTPLGFTSATMRIRNWIPQGDAIFACSYQLGNQEYNQDFKGRLSADGNRIANGQFNYIMASGTFTATRLALDCMSVQVITVPVGGTVDLPVNLTIAGERDVAIAAEIRNPDPRLTITGFPATIKKSTTDGPVLHLVASGDATPPCRTECLLTSQGLPDVVLRIRLVAKKN